VVVVVHRRDVVDVTQDSVCRRESNDGHARRVPIDGEVGQQTLHELEFVAEVGFTDARRAVNEEDEVDFTIRQTSKSLDVTL